MQKAKNTKDSARFKQSGWPRQAGIVLQESRQTKWHYVHGLSLSSLRKKPDRSLPTTMMLQGMPLTAGE